VIAHYRFQKLEVTVDGREPVSGTLVVVSNVQNYGGNFSITDRARSGSGHLDICVCHRGTILALIRYAFYALRRRVSCLADVTYLKGKTTRIDSEEPVAVEVDGDYFGTTPAVIELKPAYVPILVPHTPPNQCIP
jgi:diacylglycerol kinase (ATP)